MARIDRKRLKALESKLGAKLPSNFVSSLTKRDPIREGHLELIMSGRVRDIRTTYSLDNGDDSYQLDWIYDLIGDVMPPGAFPFASDWGGNIYCLMLSGPMSGNVVWWDHERDNEDHSVEVVAESLETFFASLVPAPPE